MFIKFTGRDGVKLINVDSVSAVEFPEDGVVAVTVGDPSGKCEEYFFHGDEADKVVETLAQQGIA